MDQLETVERLVNPTLYVGCVSVLGKVNSTVMAALMCKKKKYTEISEDMYCLQALLFQGCLCSFQPVSAETHCTHYKGMAGERVEILHWPD